MNMKNFIPLSSICCAVALLPPAAMATPLTSALNAPRVSNISNITLVAASEKDLLNAEKFIAGVADRGIGFLSNEQLTQEQRKTEFKALLKKNFDMKTIARFSLGRYWRTATKKQQDEYITLFEHMILNVYARRFSEYTGEQLIVKNSRAEGKKDILVHSNITPEKGQSIKVDWRIRNKNGHHKIIDIIVEGVSMSLTQRSDFSSVIQRGGGDVNVLLAHLRDQAK